MKLENFKLNKKLLYILGLVLIIPLIILVLINLFPKNKDITQLNTLCENIENCNNTLNTCLNDDKLDTSKSKDVFSNNILTLNNIKSQISSLALKDENNTVIKEKTLEALDYNISLYDDGINLFKNQKNINLNDKFNDYKNTYTQLLKSYDTLDSLGIHISMSNEVKNYFESTFYYFNSIIKLTRDNDIKVNQKKSYVSNLDDCIKSFSDIDEDLKPALNKIREDNRNLDVLLQDLKDKKSKLNDIKNKTYCIAIPEDGMDCYDLLQDTINYYDLYITSLEHAIMIEETSNDSDDKESIEENYTNSFAKYDDFQKSLKNLNSELDKFNNK